MFSVSKEPGNNFLNGLLEAIFGKKADPNQQGPQQPNTEAADFNTMMANLSQMSRPPQQNPFANSGPPMMGRRLNPTMQMQSILSLLGRG